MVTSVHAKLHVALTNIHLERMNLAASSATASSSAGSSASGVSPLMFARILVGHRRHTTPKFRCPMHIDSPPLQYLSTDPIPSVSSPSSPSTVSSTMTRSTFPFTISYHAHLFMSIIVDIYQERTWLGPIHLGRAELKLDSLTGVPMPYTTWLELRHSKISLVPQLAASLSLKALKTEQVVGQLQLEVNYKLARDGHRPLPDIPSSLMTSSDLGSPNEGVSADVSLDIPISQIEGDEEKIEKVIEDTEKRVESMVTESLITQATSKSPPPSSIENGDILGIDLTQKYIDSSQSSSFSSFPESLPDKSIDGVDAANDDRETIPTDEDGDEGIEVSNFFSKLAALVLNSKDQEALKAVQSIMTGFQQNMRVSNLTLTQGYLEMLRYYNERPVELVGNVMGGLDLGHLKLAGALYRYAEATMGWLGLQYTGKRSFNPMGDFFRSEANYLAVLEYLQLTREQMLVFTLGRDDEEALRPNFFVAHDPHLDAVILAIRGTMSLRDLLTDLVCEYVPWRGGYVHAGILVAARWFLQNVTPQMVMFAKELGAHNLYFCGHSLGGAVASLISILYLDGLQSSTSSNDILEDSDLKIHAYSYGPPPILSHSLHQLHHNHIDTFVNGDDIIPRLSYGTACDLQQLLILAAVERRHQKHHSDVVECINQARMLLRRQSLHPKLYLPGHVHHLVNVFVDETNKRTVVDTVPAKYFDELCIVRKMFRHHLPDGYDRSLSLAVKTWSEYAENGDKLYDAINEAPPKGRKRRHILKRPPNYYPSDDIV